MLYKLAFPHFRGKPFSLSSPFTFRIPPCCDWFSWGFVPVFHRNCALDRPTCRLWPVAQIDPDELLVED